MPDCPFCARLAHGDWDVSTELVAAFADAYPVTRGHTLVVPRRHVSRFGDLRRDEQQAVWDMADVIRSSTPDADGFNIGVNDGAAAGQTVGHVHIHVIPRRAGDAPDPRGGIRWVIPEKAQYWPDD